MIKVEMDYGTRNYLIRLLENHKKSLKKITINEYDLAYETEQISKAIDYLMGKKAKVVLNKNIEPINLGLTED